MSSAPGNNVPASSSEPDVTDIPYPDFYRSPNYQGFMLQNLNICLIVFSTLIASFRFYTKVFMTKVPSLDDYITAIAYVTLCVFSSLEIRIVRFGSGAHIDWVPPDFISKFFSALTTQQLLYVWCVGLTRLSLCAFLHRLSNDRRYTQFIYITAIVIIIQTLAGFLVRLLECKNIHNLWKVPPQDGCLSKYDEQIIMWAHAAVGVVINVTLFALPMWIVGKMMKSSTNRLRILLIFCVAGFAIITGLVRLAIMIRSDFSNDTTYKMATVGFFTDVEVHVGLWVACFPAMLLLLRRVPWRCGILVGMGRGKIKEKQNNRKARFDDLQHPSSRQRKLHNSKWSKWGMRTRDLETTQDQERRTMSRTAHSCTIWSNRERGGHSRLDHTVLQSVINTLRSVDIADALPEDLAETEDEQVPLEEGTIRVKTSWAVIRSDDNSDLEAREVQLTPHLQHSISNS